MKTLLFTILLSVISFAQNQQPQDGLKLFTIHGVQIGQSTEKDLVALGAHQVKEDAYALNGIYFWLNPLNQLVYNVNQSIPSNLWPMHWQQMGLNQSLTFEQAPLWLKSVGFLPILEGTQYHGTRITQKSVYLIKIEFQNQKISAVSLLSVPRP